MVNYYTYKITFTDLPGYFYYGQHKDNGEPYFGSPKTWKHLWDQFKPEIQILQWFETLEEVCEAESKIIQATWKSKYSLNENCNGRFSSEAIAKGALKVHSEKNFQGKSLHAIKMSQAQSLESKVKGGKNSCKNLSPEQKINRGRKMLENAIKNDPYHQSKAGKQGAKIMHLQVWRSDIDGFEGGARSVAAHNRRNGWDPKARTKIKETDG